MACFKDYELQEFIDGEGILTKDEVFFHLKNCQQCQQKYNEIVSSEELVSKSLTKYRDSVKQSIYNKKGVAKLMNIKRIVAVACVVMIATSLTFEPVRSVLANTLNIFRASEVQGVNITASDLNELSEQISNVMSEEGVNRINDSKFGKIVCNSGGYENIKLDEIKNIKDFDVKLPTINGVLPEGINVTKSHSIEYTPNVNEVNGIMKKLGMGQLLPQEIDGKSIVLSIPTTVNANYTLGKNISLNVNQAKAPEIIVPDGVNYDNLYNSVLNLPIIPQNIRQQLLSIKDWKNTIPVPVGKGTMEEVNINGTKAFINNENNARNHQYSYVVWIKDNVVYMISGNLSKDEIISYAKLFS